MLDRQAHEFKFLFGRLQPRGEGAGGGKERSLNSSLVDCNQFKIVLLFELFSTFKFLFGRLQPLIIFDCCYALIEFKFLFGRLQQINRIAIPFYLGRLNSSLVDCNPRNDQGFGCNLRSLNSSLVDCNRFLDAKAEGVVSV